MVQLRPNLTLQRFVKQVKQQSQRYGYRLAYVEDEDQIKAVAGFRISQMLSRGRFMYVDDLVTDEPERNKGYGRFLFDWLVNHAKSHHCQRLDLDSGMERKEAHKFYLRRGMKRSYHFSLNTEDWTKDRSLSY